MTPPPPPPPPPQQPPLVEWDPQVAAFLSAALGAGAFARAQAALAAPPLATCLRVNALAVDPDAVVRELRAGGADARRHPRLSCAVLLAGSGPHALDLPALLHGDGEGSNGDGGGSNNGDGSRGYKEVVVSRKAGEAILRGADVFVPGVLAVTAGLSAGDLVAVTVAPDAPGSGGGTAGMNRGTVLPQTDAPVGTAVGRGVQQQHQQQGSDSEQQQQQEQQQQEQQQQQPQPQRPRVCVGVGRARLGRVEVFRERQGIAVELTRRVYDAPPALAAAGALRGGRGMLQNLPSIVAAEVLNPAPGSRVVDCCAAPGGKATLLAQLMGGRGEVVALDRTHAKVDGIAALAAELGVGHVVRAVKMDATKAVDDGGGGAHAGGGGGCDGSNGCLQQQQQQEGAAGAGAGGGGIGDEASTSGSTEQQQQRQQQQQQPQQQRPTPEQLAALPDKARRRLERRLAAMAARGHAPPAGEFRQYAALAPPRARGFPPGSFDAALLDAPCTALGLRPRLAQPQRLAALLETACYQRGLLNAAVRLLRPGGALVYSTCTISPLENEANVRWVLDAFPDLKLVDAAPRVGGPGLTGPADPAAMHAAAAAAAAARECTGASPDALRAVVEACRGPWLSDEEARLVQRFDPAGEQDSIGFFVARFVKKTVATADE